MADGFFAHLAQHPPDLLGRLPWPKLEAGTLPAVDATALGVIALGIALRLQGLTQNSIWFDEAHSLSLANQPSLDLLLQGVVQDLQSPLYFALLRTWLEWFQGDVGARLLSVALGACSLYLTYQLGRALFSVEVGRLGALLLAVSSYHIYFSQYLRAYILLAVLALAGALALLGALREGGWHRWTLYAIVTIAALYTHIYGFALLLGYLPPAVYYVWRHRRGAWRSFVLAHLAVVASLGPWLPAMLWQLAQVQTGSDPWITPIDVYSLQSLWASLWWWSRDDFGLWPGIVFRTGWAALAVALGYGIVVGWRKWARWFVLSLLLMPPLLILVASLAGSQSVWSPRYFVFLSGPFALLVAQAIISLPHDRLRLGAVALFLLLSLPVLYTLQNHVTFRNADVRGASAWARGSFQPGDVIVHTNEQSLLPALWYDRTTSIRGPEAPYETDCVWRSMPRTWCKEQPYPQLYLDTKWNDLPTLAWYADRVWLLALYDHRKPREDLATEELVSRVIGKDYLVQRRADFLGVKAFLLTPVRR